MRLTALALCAFLFAGAAFAANPFADVARGHWAYGAIQKCVDAGILQGFDGKFHGKKLLNRYQVAVIVAKILDKVKGGMPAGMAPKGEDIRNLEALTIEFADELALLNVKVSTLEDSFVELKHDVEKLKGAGPAHHAPMHHGGFGLQGFASFGLVMTDTDAGVTNVGNDSTYFTNPFVSLAIHKDLGEGVAFNLRLMHESDVNNTGDTSANIDHAYFQVDELLGENVGGKVGAFDFTQMSMENNGAFATSDYTITESFLNRSFRKFHAYGVEFAKNEKKMAADDIDVKFAILSGTDDSADTLSHPSADGGLAEDFSSIDSAVEDDDSFGYYLYLKKDRAEGPLGWNFFYFDNGADATGTTGANDEQSIMMLGLNYVKDDMEAIFQYAKSDADLVGGGERNHTNMFLLVNYKLDETQSISLRYEDSETENAAGTTVGEFNVMTFAWNRQITDNSLLQFEYLTPDDEFGGTADADDDVVQLRYKVWF